MQNVAPGARPAPPTSDRSLEASSGDSSARSLRAWKYLGSGHGDLKLAVPRERFGADDAAEMLPLLLDALAAYLIVGLVFAAIFLTRGIHRVDPSASGSAVTFRLVILPGVVALWPFVLSTWRRGELPTERNAHRRPDGSATT